MKRKNSEYSISKKVGMAINRYNMIEAGDRVLVAVSGGKDSLALLKILNLRKKWLPIDYALTAIHITTDYDDRPEVDKEKLKSFFEEMNCEYIFKKIEIVKKNKLNRQDCFWCSWNRRKAIFEEAGKKGFRKVAMGHHKDDIAETILMNMLFKGELSSINPVQDLFEGKIRIIRPLVFLEEKDIRRYVDETELPEIKSRCPRDKTSKRALIKGMLRSLSLEDQNIKTNIIRAPHNRKEDYLMESIQN
ncbi:MAG: tRNA lysidine(34) synthetase TilS [Candidatus Omnitrophota bacterium]